MAKRGKRSAANTSASPAVATPPVDDDSQVLAVHDLEVRYPGNGMFGKPIRVLKNITVSIPQGKTLGLVGESGSGKTTLGRAILGLVPVQAGSIVFNGIDVTRATGRVRRRLARDLQVVFQDPYTSLNPAMTIGDILAEPLTMQGVTDQQARAQILELLDRVQLPHDAMQRLPREFSGGQRQRIAIARAIALRPRLIVCDEPVSALDLSTQARVLDIFTEIQQQFGVSYLFVSHDLDVIRHVSHDVAVMYRGEIVEQGPSSRVTIDPDHPYTKRLLLASPVPDPDRQAQRRAARRSLAGQATVPVAEGL